MSWEVLRDGPSARTGPLHCVMTFFEHTFPTRAFLNPPEKNVGNMQCSSTSVLPVSYPWRVQILVVVLCLRNRDSFLCMGHFSRTKIVARSVNYNFCAVQGNLTALAYLKSWCFFLHSCELLELEMPAHKKCLGPVLERTGRENPRGGLIFYEV